MSDDPAWEMDAEDRLMIDNLLRSRAEALQKTLAMSPEQIERIAYLHGTGVHRISHRGCAVCMADRLTEVESWISA